MFINHLTTSEKQREINRPFPSYKHKKLFSVPKYFDSSLSSEGISAFYVDGKKKQLLTSWGDYSHKHNEVKQEDIVALGISCSNIEEIVDYTQRKYDEKYISFYLFYIA